MPYISTEPLKEAELTTDVPVLLPASEPTNRRLSPPSKRYPASDDVSDADCQNVESVQPPPSASILQPIFTSKESRPYVVSLVQAPKTNGTAC